MRHDAGGATGQAPLTGELRVRRLGRVDAESYRALRLRGLIESPEAFGSTVDEDSALTFDAVAARIEHSVEAGQATYGAFSESSLIGIVGCMRVRKTKSRHRAIVLGMYVAPEARHRGAGRLLLEQLIADVRTWPGVEWLTLTVVERAHAAHSLYIAMGFREWGREVDGLRDGDERDTVVHMALPLTHQVMG